MARRKRRKMRLNGVLDLDMGTRVGNVIFGASASAIGNVVGPKLPVIGPHLAALPGSPGLAVGLGLAGLTWSRGKQRAATDIAIGAVLPSAMLMLEHFIAPMFGADMGYVVPTAEKLGLVHAQAELSDGSIDALALQDGYEIPSAVLQGFNNKSVEVFQGGAW